MMSKRDACLNAKEDGKTGSIIGWIGHIMIIIALIGTGLIFYPPASYYAVTFMLYAGWLIFVIGVILAIIARFKIKKQMKICSIV